MTGLLLCMLLFRKLKKKCYNNYKKTPAIEDADEKRTRRRKKGLSKTNAPIRAGCRIHL